MALLQSSGERWSGVRVWRLTLNLSGIAAEFKALRAGIASNVEHQESRGKSKHTVGVVYTPQIESCGIEAGVPWIGKSVGKGIATVWWRLAHSKMKLHSKEVGAQLRIHVSGVTLLTLSGIAADLH